MFYLGQKVQCVDNSNQDQNLKVGQTYVIDRAEFIGAATKTYVWVVGVYDNYKPTGGGSLYASRFRPLVEKKTDISVFTALLKPKLVDV
jgi:hypothetical protein